jgi:hypothetical protein
MVDSFAPNVNIFDHGIVFEGGQHPDGLRLIATTRLPIHSGFNLSIIDENGRSLNQLAASLANVKGPHTQDDFYEEYDLRHCVLATLYHLNRLIELYVGVCQLFESMQCPLTTVSGNASDPRAFYEIGAFLGAARRVYESIRKSLWKHYRNTGATGRWRSIRTVLHSFDHRIPASFVSELHQSWNSIGDKLAAYRDCVAHYDPLTPGHTTCWMERYGQRWGMSIRLPANPDRKNRRVFDFASGPEALSYCHSVACHLVGLCESLEAQEKVALFLANPPK